MQLFESYQIKLDFYLTIYEKCNASFFCNFVCLVSNLASSYCFLDNNDNFSCKNLALDFF